MPTPPATEPTRLYVMCLQLLCSLLEKRGAQLDLSSSDPGPLDKVAGVIVDDLLSLAQKSVKSWNNAWVVFLTPKISAAVLKWEKQLLNFIASRCKNLRKVMFKWVSDEFDPDMLKTLPKNITSVDFDGELYNRGKDYMPELEFQSWLPEAETVLKSLSLNLRKVQPMNEKFLVEVHLGTLSVTADQLTGVLQLAPNLKLLRHYQLVSALYKLHAEVWKQGNPLPKYKLNNLDADFSHVVRCRMSPHAVLPGDAMRLATQLCPDVSSVRVRIDCSTPHDILVPLVTLKRLKELSIVCVTSGERCNLDFSDISPILEAHGQTSLSSLELKVIEEVESHLIVSLCPRLTTLTLSGCGFVCPPSCASYMCGAKPSYLWRLKLLFYADGDDFSWTHNVPQCFWKATLSTSSTKKSRLVGIFLESPRISETTAREIWQTSQSPLYPDLRVVSLFRYSEITLDNINALTHGAPLSYLRASDCERIHPKRLRQMCSKPDLVIFTS